MRNNYLEAACPECGASRDVHSKDEDVIFFCTNCSLVESNGPNADKFVQGLLVDGTLASRKDNEIDLPEYNKNKQTLDGLLKNKKFSRVS